MPLHQLSHPRIERGASLVELGNRDGHIRELYTQVSPPFAPASFGEQEDQVQLTCTPQSVASEAQRGFFWKPRSFVISCIRTCGGSGTNAGVLPT